MRKPPQPKIQPIYTPAKELVLHNKKEQRQLLKTNNHQMQTKTAPTIRYQVQLVQILKKMQEEQMLIHRPRSPTIIR